MSSSADTTSKTGERQDPLYHCSICPVGRGNTFDRLTSSARQVPSSSFEAHVKHKHPEHTGDYQALLGPTNYKFRKYSYKTKSSQGKKAAKGPLASSESGITKYVEKTAKKTTTKKVRKPLAVKIEKPFPIFEDNSSNEYSEETSEKEETEGEDNGDEQETDFEEGSDEEETEEDEEGTGSEEETENEEVGEIEESDEEE